MAKAAAPKKPLSDEQEARVQALADAVKHAPDLRSLHRALMALVNGGEDGEHAFKRIALNNLRRFSSKRPSNDGAISWDSGSALVLGEEGLEASRIVERIDAPKAGPAVAPKERKDDTPRPESKDEKPAKGEGEDGSPANDGAELESEASPELEPPSAEELATRMQERLAAAGFTVKTCKVSLRSSGVRFSLVASYRGGKDARGEWPWPRDAMHGDNLREFLDGLVEGLRGEG